MISAVYRPLLDLPDRQSWCFVLLIISVSILGLSTESVCSGVDCKMTSVTKRCTWSAAVFSLLQNTIRAMPASKHSSCILQFDSWHLFWTLDCFSRSLLGFFHCPLLVILNAGASIYQKWFSVGDPEMYALALMYYICCCCWVVVCGWTSLSDYKTLVEYDYAGVSSNSVVFWL